jgi:hypothetical protein
MTLRSRLAIPIAATALAVAAAATPAVADDARHSGGTNSAQPSPDGDDWGDGGGEGGDDGGQGGGGGGQEGDWGSGGGGGGDGGDWGSGGGGGGGGGQGGDGGNDNQSRARGRVTAGTLLLRSAPNRGSQVIRTVHRGDIVSIFCKTPGQNVQGNSIWYLLPDGTWAWGSARYIKVLGHKPRWC